MAQKMEFLSEDVASAHEPSTDESKAWYANNSQKFALADRVTFGICFSGLIAADKTRSPMRSLR